MYIARPLKASQVLGLIAHGDGILFAQRMVGMFVCLIILIDGVFVVDDVYASERAGIANIFFLSAFVLFHFGQG